MSRPSHFMKLPMELRFKVYEAIPEDTVLCCGNVSIPTIWKGRYYVNFPADADKVGRRLQFLPPTADEERPDTGSIYNLLLVCKSIYAEFLPVILNHLTIHFNSVEAMIGILNHSSEFVRQKLHNISYTYRGKAHAKAAKLLRKTLPDLRYLTIGMTASTLSQMNVVDGHAKKLAGVNDLVKIRGLRKVNVVIMQELTGGWSETFMAETEIRRALFADVLRKTEEARAQKDPSKTSSRT